MPQDSALEPRIMRKLDALRRRPNSLHHALCSIQSPLFSRDISSAIAMLAVVTATHLGFQFYWQVLLAYVSARFVMAAFYDPAPAKVDNRLLPVLCSIRGSSSASPSIAVATVLFLELAMASPHSLGAALCFLAIGVLSYARLLSMAFFPHQIISSVALGVIAVRIVRVAFASEVALRLDSAEKLAVSVVGLLLVMMEISLRIEDCSAVVMRDACVKKREYVRVMSELWKVQPPRGNAGSDSGVGIGGKSYTVDMWLDDESELTGTESERTDERTNEQFKQKRKRDSFVRLVQTMEKRSLEATIRQNLLGSLP